MSLLRHDELNERRERRRLAFEVNYKCEAKSFSDSMMRSTPQAATSIQLHHCIPLHDDSKGEVENEFTGVNTWIRVNDPSAGSPTER